MKRNLYDIFDAFNSGEQQTLPKLKEQGIDSKSVADRVFEKADIHPVKQTKRRSYRIFGIAAAIAVLAGGTITAGAVSGKMDEFFKSVSKADIQGTVPSENLPAVNMELPEAIAEMQPYYNCPDVSFTQTESGTMELLGLYNDSNSLMMSFRLTVQDDTVLTDDMKMLPYFTFTLKDGTKKESTLSGFVSEPFQKSETEDNVYYLTYYLVDSELAGALLHIDFAGVYTSSQENAVFEKMVALDNELQEKYFTEDMEIGEWKKFQHENGFDELRDKTRKEYYAQQQSVLKGGWSADIPIPDPQSEPFTIETDHNVYILDDLSLYISRDNDYDPYNDDFDLSKEENCGSAIFLKDGTIIADDFRMFKDIQIDPNDSRYILEGTRYKEFPYSYGTFSAGSDTCDGIVHCYSRPISLSEIDKIIEYTHYWDENDTEQFNEYVIFEAE